MGQLWQSELLLLGDMLEKQGSTLPLNNALKDFNDVLKLQKRLPPKVCMCWKNLLLQAICKSIF